LIRTLVEVAARGGNFLLNVGRRPKDHPAGFEARLLASAPWLKVNGEASYGTTYAPCSSCRSRRTTAKKARRTCTSSTGPRKVRSAVPGVAR